MAMTETRRALIAELVQLQNKWSTQDILTITGFMNDAEVAQHVERYREVIARKGER